MKKITTHATWGAVLLLLTMVGFLRIYPSFAEYPSQYLPPTPNIQHMVQQDVQDMSIEIFSGSILVKFNSTPYMYDFLEIQSYIDVGLIDTMIWFSGIEPAMPAMFEIGFKHIPCIENATWWKFSYRYTYLEGDTLLTETLISENLYLSELPEEYHHEELNENNPDDSNDGTSGLSEDGGNTGWTFNPRTFQIIIGFVIAVLASAIFISTASKKPKQMRMLRAYISWLKSNGYKHSPGRLGYYIKNVAKFPSKTARRQFRTLVEEYLDHMP